MLIKKTDNLSGEGDHIHELKPWLAQKISTAARKIVLFHFRAQYYAKKILFSLKHRHQALFKGFSNHFPAIHLKRSLDSWDYALNFSGELLATGLVIIVAVANLAAFGVFKHTDRDLSDNSLAGSLLARHSSYNPGLYAKANSIKTTMVKQKGIISAAYADNGALSSDSNNGVSVSGNGGDEITDNVMAKPNPDTTRALLEKQIQVYETQPGDTMSSIAAKFGVSRNTVKWSNNLGDSIKPGWYLMIPPIDGVVYEANSNDTLPDIAKYFHGNLDRIISYNNLGSAEDIEAGQWIICPDCTVPAPPAPPAPTPPAPGKHNPSSTLPTNRPGSGGRLVILGHHSFPRGYCTYYVSTKMDINFGGNAKSWLGNAAAAGYTVARSARVGSAVVTTDSARYGHVAYVTGVQSNGDITVSEMNYAGFGVVSTRTISADSGTIRGFIYPR